MSLPIEFTLAQIPKHVRNAVVNGAYTKVGVVRSVIAQDGLPSMAIVDFDDETGVETKLMNGAGTPTHPGMTVRVERQGGVIDPTWKIVDVLSGPRISFGEPVVALMAKPVVPGASSGGVYTESQTATADNPNAIADPGAAVKARVYLYPRSVVLGSYSAYQQRAKAIRVQGRELGDTEWPDQFSDWPINPNALLYGYTSGAISASATSITFVTSVDRVNEMLVDQPAYWQIESEIVLAIATPTVTPGQYTLTVVAHNGTDDATLGQGFVASASGRGLEGTTAASHAHNSVVTLLSASVAPGDLRPGTDYELRLAFVNASNQAGPWSDIVGVTTWEQPVPPAAPASLTVAHLSSVIQAQWNPVVTDANGDFRSDVKRYLAVRHTAALAVGLSLAQVLSAGATQVADTPATVISVPATKGNGNFIGVAAVGSEGLVSDWSWEKDDLAPPYPDPAGVTIESIPGGIAVYVDPAAGSYLAQSPNTYSSTPSKDDPGFYEYVILRSNESDGGEDEGEVAEKGSFIGGSGFIPLQATDQTGWFKVVTRDRSGNRSNTQSPNNAGYSTGWKYANSLWPQDTYPQNGNLQLSNDSQTKPKFWDWTVHSPTRITPTYQLDGGIIGNRVIRLEVPYNPAFGGATNAMELYSTAPHPTNINKQMAVRFWARQSAINPNGYIDFMVYADYYSDDAGTSYLGESLLGLVDSPEPAEWWSAGDTEWAFFHYAEPDPAKDISGNPFGTARTVRLRIEVNVLSNNLYSAHTKYFYLDDFIVDWGEYVAGP